MRRASTDYALIQRGCEDTREGFFSDVVTAIPTVFAGRSSLVPVLKIATLAGERSLAMT
jgi:hypothetical protein